MAYNYYEDWIMERFERTGKWPDEDPNYDDEQDCPGDYDDFWEAVDRLKELHVRGDNPWLPDLTRAEIDDCTGCK